MAASISAADFQDALTRYPAVIQTFSKKPRGDALSLEDLDKFRYQVAPVNFSKNTGRNINLSDLIKLVDWKLTHGVYRPSLQKLVASNTNEKIESSLNDAFATYAKNPSDIATVIEKIKENLKGVGPATASLILAVHDPQNVVFFSDEVFRWLTADGKKVKIGYTTKEFETLSTAAKNFMARINCTPIELEKVAFVLVKENEPVYEPKPKKEPSGRGRGRPPLPDSEKKAKKPTVPGRGRGRPPGAGVAKAKAAKAKSTKAEKAAKETGNTDAEEEVHTKTSVTKKRGRPSLETTDGTATPASNKRGRPSLTAGGKVMPSTSNRRRPAELEAEKEIETSASKKQKTTPVSSA
ncbi:hypothetical protein QTJ16_003447 [Diplocarpon rosae]|uniref:Uncharacterized protein n=1 Tax=Diplocarpon rosae TaxID=946125 RepID=A0AAD9WFL7_9HELO|nr:hypothetical protein QTJ16_003447 [Diplocarpon rosae]